MSEIRLEYIENGYLVHVAKRPTYFKTLTEALEFMRAHFLAFEERNGGAHA